MFKCSKDVSNQMNTYVHTSATSYQHKLLREISSNLNSFCVDRKASCSSQEGITLMMYPQILQRGFNTTLKISTTMYDAYHAFKTRCNFRYFCHQPLRSNHLTSDRPLCIAKVIYNIDTYFCDSGPVIGKDLLRETEVGEPCTKVWWCVTLIVL